MKAETRIRRAIAKARGHCELCGRFAGAEDYCHGCGHVVCVDHNHTEGYEHALEDHQR